MNITLTDEEQYAWWNSLVERLNNITRTAMKNGTYTQLEKDIEKMSEALHDDPGSLGYDELSRIEMYVDTMTW